MSIRDNYQNPHWVEFGLSINPYALLRDGKDIEYLRDAVRAHWRAIMIMVEFGEMPYFEALKLFETNGDDSDEEVVESLTRLVMVDMKHLMLI